MKKRFPAKTAAMIFGAALFAAQAHMSFAAVSDEGAGDIKKQVEAAIAVPMDMEKTTGMGLALGGPVEVTPKGDYYEVKLPSVTYGTDGMKADFGTITMNVTPADDTYKMTMALPASIVISDAAKTPVAEIKLGSQNFNGVWLPKYRAFTNLDAEYKDVSITSAKAGDKVNISIGSIKSTLDMKPDGTDIWSGPANFELSKLHLTGGSKNEFDLNIDNVTGSGTYSKLNMAVRKDVEDKTEQALQGAQKQPKPDPAQIQAMLSSVMSSLQNYIDGMGSNFKISGVTLKVVPDAKDEKGQPEKPVDVALNSLSWGFKVDGMQEPKGAVSLTFGMDGLSISNMEASTASMLPTSSNLEIHLDNLPIPELSKGLSGLFGQVVSSAVATQSVTDAAQKTALQNQVQAQVAAAMLTIPATLATAGAKLSIVNTYAKAPDVGTTLDGSFTASATSKVMAEGSITLLITGLDELIVKLQGLAQSASGDPKVMGMAQGLGMLQMMGQASKAADGRSQRSYKLDVSPDGKVMLNGADFSNTLGAMGMGGGGKPGATAPTPDETPPQKKQ